MSNLKDTLNMHNEEQNFFYSQGMIISSRNANITKDRNTIDVLNQRKVKVHDIKIQYQNLNGFLCWQSKQKMLQIAAYSSEWNMKCSRSKVNYKLYINV
jgi:flagellar basal body rod protein FlgB